MASQGARTPESQLLPPSNSVPPWKLGEALDRQIFNHGVPEPALVPSPSLGCLAGRKGVLTVGPTAPGGPLSPLVPLAPAKPWNPCKKCSYQSLGPKESVPFPRPGLISRVPLPRKVNPSCSQTLPLSPSMLQVLFPDQCL